MKAEFFISCEFWSNNEYIPFINTGLTRVIEKKSKLYICCYSKVHKKQKILLLYYYENKFLKILESHELVQASERILINWVRTVSSH
jgi:hypothetical protein